MADESSKGVDVAMWLMANSAHERIRDYVDRGRRFQTFDAAALRGAYIAANEAWGSDPFDPVIRQTSDDINAEYELREKAPPIADVAEHIDKGLHKVAETAEKLTEARRDEINEEMIRDYDAAQRQRN